MKKMQLMELAILNGTYRDNNIKTRKSGERLKNDTVRLAAFMANTFTTLNIFF